ncbi:hypothetical protein AMK59_5116, partial [Oryctes borbonicus]
RTSELQTLSEEVRLFISNKFKIPDFKLSLLENLKVRIDRSHTELYFPLENIQMETVGYKIFKDTIDEHIIEPTVTSGGILIGKSTKKKDTAILVPNILDFLTLMNAGISRNVICLPNGLLNLPLYILPSFERFSKLILWFGNDVQSWENRTYRNQRWHPHRKIEQEKRYGNFSTEYSRFFNVDERRYFPKCNMSSKRSLKFTAVYIT